MQLTTSTKYTLSGIAFGIVFPLVAWNLDIFLSGLTLSPDVIVQIHQNNAIHYVVDLAPFVLGTVFYFLGKTYQRALNRNYFSSILAEDRITGSTSRFKLVISIVVVLILLFLGTASWYMQHVMRLKTQAEIGTSLDIILTTSEQAAYFKLQEEQSNVLIWARTEHIVRAAQALLLERYSRQKLIASPAQTTLRTWFEPIAEIRGYQGFFIISPEGVNLASSRDSNTGQVNILTQQHPEFLQKIRQGNTALSTPQHAQVALLDPEGKLSEGLITMFVGAPIKDESGQIIATLAFRLDPQVDLSPILRQGRMGESGETYAFIKEGEIITQSRFDQQIKKYGLTFLDAAGIEHLEVRDPGVNLTLGEQTNTPREQQPFTRMAISAIAGESGQNLDGYRDYRGVPVIGSWLWSDRLGFGMTTEIDVAEAYAVLNFNRGVITISTLILGMLILGFVAILTRFLHESRRSVQILIENEETIRLLLNSTGEAIYGIDLNGECTFANRTCLELLGNQSEQELLGKNMHTLIHHTRNDGTPYPVEECRIFKAFKEGEGTHVDDEVFWRADGSSFPTEYRSFPIRRHEKIIGSVVSFTDISTQQEDQIIRRAVVETMIDGFIIINEDGMIESFNPAAEKIFGYSSEEIIGKNIKQLMPESYRSTHETGLERYKKTGEAHILGRSGVEIEGLRKDGSIFPLAITISEMFIGDKRLFNGVIRDITERVALDLEVKASAARFRSFFEVTQEGIVFHDQGTILDMNPKSEEITGYDRDEMIGHNVLEFIAPESKETIIEKMTSDIPEHYQVMGQRKDGSKNNLDLHGSTYKYGDKNIGVASFRDVTTQLENEIRHRTIFKTILDGFVTISEEGIVISFNPAAEKIFGYSEDEIIGKNIKQLMPEPHHSQHDGYLEHYRKTGEEHIINIIGRELEGIHKDGTIIPIAISISEMTISGKRSYVGVIRDVTAMKALQAGQEKVAAELTQLIDTANAPIFGIDTQGKVTEWNQTAVKLTGFEKDEIQGRDLVEDFITEEFRKPVKAVLDNALQGVETATYEFPLYTKDGQRLDILFNATTRRDIDGNITGVIGIGQDITELRQKETALQQAQKMEAVGQLTGGIAHDFNNLLSIISGNLRFLKQDIGDVGEEINELFEDAMSAVQDGSELTQRLLSFSRNRKLKAEEKNVNDTIEKFVRFLSRTIGESIELIIDLPSEDLFINVDPSQLENALLNLTLNARDAMPEGGRITISATRYHHGDEYNLVLSEGDYIEISITDTGTGISPEDLQHVYEPFFTTKKVGKGSGLGLSMVYGFTQQSGGASHIKSTLGEGTTVSMVFPEIPESKRIEKAKVVDELAMRGSEVILVVEDEPRVRRVALRDLKKLGYKTLEAENADMARAMIESGKNIDLMFSDILMPGEMNGHMLAIWVEENHPEIKVVLTSGYSKGQADMTRDQARPFPLVRKPYSINKLAKQIRITLTG